MQIRVTPDGTEIKRALDLLFDTEQVIELRALKTIHGTVSGYYRDHEKLARDAAKISVHPSVPAVYVTLQALTPTKARDTYAKNVATTSADKDIAQYRWLMCDCDPVRPSGVSSTDAEKVAAREVAENVRDYFEWLNGCNADGYASVLADSGNGFHVLLRLHLDVSDTTRDLVKSVLAALSLKFSTDACKVDTTVFNPARICKLYGTVSRKGEDTAERPHRTARLIDTPEKLEVVPVEVLQRIAAAVPASKPKVVGAAIASEDVEAKCQKMEQFLAKAGVAHRQRMEYGAGSFKWQLEQCVFNPEHRAPDSFCFVQQSGAVGWKCSHDSCAKNGWHEFRAALKPRTGKFSFQVAAKKQAARRTA
jgi:hypothetical protein